VKQFTAATAGKIILIIIAGIVTLAAPLTIFVTPSAAAASPSMTEEQKTLYAVGMSVARTLEIFDLTPSEFDLVKQGLIDAQPGNTKAIELAPYANKVQELARVRRKVKGDLQAAGGKEFLEKAAKENGAVKTDSGMVYISRVEGLGATPQLSDTVKVHYRGSLTDGKEFDSSFKRNSPAEFKLDGVIKCWTEGVQKMKPGGKARFVCPASLAYGDVGNGEYILPGATLVFDVELLEVKK
jgi:FKBP-type peptidyl-prolyl cis-trans isomerase FkpA